MALDCPAVRILPHFEPGKTLIEGYVNTGSPRPGVRRRDRIRSLLATPAASAPVILQVGPASHALILDGEGAFSWRIPNWTGTATLGLIDPVASQTLWQKEMCLPPPPDFLMVSDIDDTIQVTEVTRRVRLVINSLLKTVEDREAVPGTPPLYRHLAAASPAHGRPLVVYLSCSPAAMARSLEGFFARQGFPEGVLITKHTLHSDGSDPAVHKTKWLRRLADAYPGRPFLLLGDSGEKDPEIYADFIKEGSRPCLGIIIRQVPGREARDAGRLNALATDLAAAGIPFLVWRNPDELRSALVTLGFALP
ncbi:MAG: hypothetical protein OZSIB_2660 [Candidatus Ozemobacter sibiricus]|jgi:hypothetical protein|uniref:Phosphatidate phosphatase APP1 catalytic domain-containing protein n=1 Tax=Candidatus Ozemobacter sibiricus TaxID=2268124 RepID=A0A367ZTU2_9BACT|nr:MAG: hypothetical protein OZSIB_2660 [Candidatus Ozemobacter sibiricus]